MRKIMLKQFNLYLYIVIVTLFFSLFNFFILNNIDSNFEYKNHFESVEYDYTVITESRKQDYYYDCGFRCSLEKNDDGSFSKFITSNTLMLSDINYQGYGYYNRNNIYLGEYKILNNNEASITNNIATTFGIEINDTIYGLVNGNVVEYKIVNILYDTYDFSFPQPDKFQRYIFVGYDENFDVEERFLSFVKYDTTPEKNASNYCIKNQVIKRINTTIILQISLTVLVCYIFVFLYFKLNKKDIYNYLLIYNHGFSKNKILRLNTLYTLFVLFVNLILLTIVSVILSINILIIIIELLLIYFLVYLINNIKILRRI